jgi:hypothetical protein
MEININLICNDLFMGKTAVNKTNRRVATGRMRVSGRNQGRVVAGNVKVPAGVRIVTYKIGGKPYYAARTRTGDIIDRSGRSGFTTAGKAASVARAAYRRGEK